MGKKSLTIFWTEPAKNDLRKIFDYLAEISVRIAENQIIRIMERVDILEKGFSESGQIEPLLKKKKYCYRYLVKDHYKIIYHEHDDMIFIDMVFDTRQNPQKMNDIVELK